MRGTITHTNHTKGIYRLRCEDGLYRVVECEDASAYRLGQILVVKPGPASDRRKLLTLDGEIREVALHYESGRGDLGDQFFK